MSDRIFVWHIPSLPAEVPTYYIDKDCLPTALRIYAERAPGSGDLLVDILDDGVSIMNGNNYQKVTFKDEPGYIEFGTPSGTFTVVETITGGTSGATAKVTSNRCGRLGITDASTTAFTVAETITGGSSSATGVVNAYVKAIKNSTKEVIAGQSRANLPKNKNAHSAAQDFKPGVQIAEGSWVSLSLLDAAGASGITVQLEVEELAVSTEKRHLTGN